LSGDIPPIPVELFTRKGNGGWTIETPGAQCIGKHIFEYSIAYHTGGWKENSSYGLMEKKLLPCLMKQIPYSKYEIPENTLRWVSELPKEIRLSALKVSEDGTGIIVRLFSIGDAVSTVTLPVPKSIQSVQRVNLSEKNIEEIKLQDNCITFFVKPSEIITIKLIG
jgi:alpha-mannosidase